MIRRLLCLLGWHEWIHSGDGIRPITTYSMVIEHTEYYRCKHCKKRINKIETKEVRQWLTDRGVTHDKD